MKARKEDFVSHPSTIVVTYGAGKDIIFQLVRAYAPEGELKCFLDTDYTDRTDTTTEGVRITTKIA